MSFQDPFDRPSATGLRAGDADRERTADVLRRHHAEGRLRDEEFEQRIERCYQARTLAELDRLSADLPREDRMPTFGGVGRSLQGGPRSPIVAIAAVVGVVWLVGSVLSPFAWDREPGYVTPHPPLIALLLLAFVAWRLLGSRRRDRFMRR